VTSSKKKIPRWEWRIFAPSLAPLEAKIGLSIQIPSKPTDEIYLLTSSTPHSAKIRDGSLEVKRLEEISAEGLELWAPAFEGAFPLSAQALGAALAAMDLPYPRVERDSFSMDEFMNEVAGRGSPFEPVRVTKSRRQFQFWDCISEFARVSVDAAAAESFCIEDEKPSKVMAALAALGLDARSNINFPEGLKRMLR
jgi:hypothetical protein